MSKICNICGAESPDEAKFCRKCGKQSFNVSGNESDLSINEDSFYEQAWSEVEESKQIKSLWAKAFTQSEGNSEKTKAIYMKLRVDALKKEAEEQINLAKKKLQEESIESELNKLPDEDSLQVFLKKNAINISKKISDYEYIVSRQSSPIDSNIKYINGTWTIV